jgi:hypothetical protein
VKAGANRNAIGDMVCATSKRVVRDMARKAVKEGWDKKLSKPRIVKARRSNCG